MCACRCVRAAAAVYDLDAGMPRRIGFDPYYNFGWLEWEVRNLANFEPGTFDDDEHADRLEQDKLSRKTLKPSMAHNNQRVRVSSARARKRRRTVGRPVPWPVPLCESPCGSPFCELCGVDLVVPCSPSPPCQRSGGSWRTPAPWSRGCFLRE